MRVLLARLTVMLRRIEFQTFRAVLNVNTSGNANPLFAIPGGNRRLGGDGLTNLAPSIKNLTYTAERQALKFHAMTARDTTQPVTLPQLNPLESFRRRLNTRSMEFLNFFGADNLTRLLSGIPNRRQRV